MEYVDQQGFNIKIGVAYQFVFAMPGPDVTSIVIEELKEDGTVSGWDVNFKFKLDSIKPDRLWRPLKHTWENKWDRKAIIEYAGESALNLEP